jgi:hypothetical protein
VYRSDVARKANVDKGVPGRAAAPSRITPQMQISEMIHS